MCNSNLTAFRSRRRKVTVALNGAELCVQVTKDCMIELPVNPEHLTAQLMIHRPRMMLLFWYCMSVVRPHAVQLVNVCVWVAPNAILLRHNCQWFEPFVIWSAFTSWTCWNTIFLIMLIEAHNCAPWDKGRAIARGGQSFLVSFVTCSYQMTLTSCQAHMQCWVMLTSTFCGLKIASIATTRKAMENKQS